MNKALQSYTPTAHPLNYDSLQSREGCGAVAGKDAQGSLAFAQLCSFAHDIANPIFTQPGTVSYSVGPVTPGVALPYPHKTIWTAWVGSTGIRIGQVGIVVPPSDGLGGVDSLFPTTVTKKITHCFNQLGLLHIAIEKQDVGFIELKRYTNTSGVIADISFAGYSPALFNIFDIEPSGLAGVVCYYLRAEHPFQLFARFSQDAFTTEALIMPALTVNVTRLQSITSQGNAVKLYAIDDINRDITLTSPAYPIRSVEKATLSAYFISGAMNQTAVAVSASSKSQTGAYLVKGNMYAASASPGTNIRQDNNRFSVSFITAEMTLQQ